MIISRSLTFIASLAVALAWLPSSWGQVLGPDELVRRVTQEVLEAIAGDKGLQAGDRTKALALAERKVLPHVDFEHMTRLATGPGWRTANETQRQALVVEFRTLLIRTYASMLGVYRGQTLEVLPLRANAGAAEVTVRNRYLQPGTPPVSVDYAMSKTEQGWKIYDIAVEGISLVVTYRGSFEDELRRGGVDGLIAKLREKNAQYANNR
jgi:phospholipid transport system substrate-binding protein